MIISASRRTDIPALYPEWFMNRLLAEEVLVPNPYNRKKVSRIKLTPATVDCFVFWTKNPEPLLPSLKKIDLLGYPYYFEMTITDYRDDLEPNVPSTEEAMATFMLLSERIGRERMDLRFDPIIINEKYTLDYHLEQFEMMCDWLHAYTDRCIISFVDYYRGSPFVELETEDMIEAAKGLVKIADKYRLPLYTCAEKVDLRPYGVRPGACIDRKKVENIVGYRLDVKRDRRQRKACGCVESIDIGTYGTCTHGCRYCYATGNLESAKRRYELHDVNSPMLIGSLKGDEAVTDRRMQLQRDDQISIFEFI